MNTSNIQNLKAKVIREPEYPEVIQDKKKNNFIYFFKPVTPG